MRYADRQYLTDDQISDKLQKLYEDRSEMQREYDNIIKAISYQLLDSWAAQGGCRECWGGGLVVTWSTLDGPGWTERGECPSCTEQSKALGRAPGCVYVGGYGAYEAKAMKVDEIGQDSQFKHEFALLSTYEIHLKEFDHLIEVERERCEVGPGKVVVVIKGRKVAKGTTGECFWIGDDRYSGGKRIGFNDAAGTTHWTAIENVKVA